jgi:hydroxymethylbilane synthase
MKNVIRLGTRDSDLAIWQANAVKSRLEAQGNTCELVPLKATGDLQLDTPLYELGITGIFTRTLDLAMIRGEIDIAVHSLKDVPTQLPKGIVQAAVLERANPRDILVHKGLDFLNTEGVVATGSLRRQAQWLSRYPLHTIEDLRGNLNTRLKKLWEGDWDAAIFAAAGLERINSVPPGSTELKWMVPAPAQGAMVVVARKKDAGIREALALLNHKISALCTGVERAFLRELEGGCTAPIGALATVEAGLLRFQGILSSLDGQENLQIEKEVPIIDAEGLGIACARELLESGGSDLMGRIKKAMAAKNQAGK